MSPLLHKMSIKLRPHQSRALLSMKHHNKGQIVVPTGGGKTFIMIQDLIANCDEGDDQVNVIVAPRILLAQQLCDDFRSFTDEIINPSLNILHVHSGRTPHKSTTKCDEIISFIDENPFNKMIFTTYHSLHRIVESGIKIDTIYFDEAHNSTARSFFESVSKVSEYASRCYYFTATPRVSYKHERGMNNAEVYGTIIENVPAPELIKGGSILPPTIVPFEHDVHYSKENAHVHHSETVQSILDSIDETHDAKVLVSVPSSRVLNNMLGRTLLLKELGTRGYDVLHITSKFGAYVNKTKVNRTKFFETLKEWGQESNKKFVIFHYSILSEGINVSGLTHTIFLRNLNVIEMAQSIGRVIRLDKSDSKNIQAGNIPAGVVSLYRKSTGYCVVPVHKDYGTKCIKRLNRITNDIFVEGTHTHAVC